MGRTLNDFSPSKHQRGIIEHHDLADMAESFKQDMYNSKYSENFETVNSAQKRSLLQPSQEIHMFDGENSGRLSKKSHSEQFDASTKKAATSAARSKYLEGINSRSGAGDAPGSNYGMARSGVGNPIKENKLQNYF